VADKKYTVLVLCTGNSCRSQMAEVLLNHDLAGQVRALSAGTRPQPKVADGAIAALKEAGLRTDGLHPKDIDAVMNEDIDLVVTVCDNAKEACPIFPKPIARRSTCRSTTRTASRWKASSRCATTSALAWWRRYARNSAASCRSMSAQCRGDRQGRAAGAPMSVFERWLTLWVALCIVAGVACWASSSRRRSRRWAHGSRAGEHAGRPVDLDHDHPDADEDRFPRCIR
jgi:protein-tyrosine-phosphatase